MIIEGKRFTQYNETFKKMKSISVDENNTFRPQKIGERIKLLAGIDEGKYAISMISDNYDIDISSTKLIQVRKFDAPLNKVATIFTLTDDNLLSIFISFAIDLESVIEYDKKVSAVEIYNRYSYWQKMFRVESDSVSESMVKGLLNELYLIQNYMIPKYGIEEAIKGWMGSEGVHKDFAYGDGMWYEAKSIDVGKTTVRISSIEQLESNQTGMLIVTDFEKTSPENPRGLRLIDLLSSIKNSIEVETIQMAFIEKVYSLGITLDVFENPDHKANQIRFVVKKVNCYEVDEAFPRLTRKHLSKEIGLVSYELVISEINRFELDFY